jgi:2-oxoglutarate dehydrogenase E2 component (dihydrolipoamide succinyltransferase)
VSALEFRLPDVGEGIATAEILAWQVAEGDHVREHQDLVEIQTDKAIAVIPCPATGVVARLCAAEGDSLDVGAVLAVFEVDGAVPSNGAGAGASRRESRAAAPTSEPRAAAASEPRPAAAAALPLAAPTTRRLARELGVDLAAVQGSGPQGRILREDVERAAAGARPPAPATEPPAPQAAPIPGEVIALRGVRRTIAHTLTRAWLEVPRVIDYREVDATALLRARASLKQRAVDRGDDPLAKALTPMPLIVRAAVIAARDNPYVNASIDLEAERITLHRHYHVGIAAAGPDGLVVPVVRDADRRSLAEIEKTIADFGRRARDGALAIEEMQGGTFTISNGGVYGSLMSTPILNAPQSGILGMHKIQERPMIVDGAIKPRPMMYLALSYDHRIVDGREAVTFLVRVKELLEDPARLVLDL